jgi:hypothetical protein
MKSDLGAPASRYPFFAIEGACQLPINSTGGVSIIAKVNRKETSLLKGFALVKGPKGLIKEMECDEIENDQMQKKQRFTRSYFSGRPVSFPGL